ncbi:MAG: NAD(P)H-hydrate dehydratase [Chloroflexota bacterium]|nr:NAD(P)H-hydrate dehydratase [Chloroflexota bacterium]
MNIYTIEQMQALERAADEAGHSYDAMMEAAGRGVARAVDSWLGEEAGEGTHVLVLVGPGNNGGDGLVAAREWARRQYSVAAYVWKREESDPLVRAARRNRVTILQAEHDDGEKILRRALARADVVIDALFGTGLSRPIEGKPAAVLDVLREEREEKRRVESLTWINRPERELRTHRPVLIAVDVPSGLHGDSGEVDNATVAADLTITFAGPKLGMLTDKGAQVLGELVVADIGIPEEVKSRVESQAQLLTPLLAASLLPERPPSGHKGTFGTTLVIGGSVNYVGAPALSALGAGRSGAGLVTLGVPTPVQPMLAARPDLTTATWLLLPHDMGVLRATAIEVLEESLNKADALVLGPGLGGEVATHRFVWALFGVESEESKQPTIGFVPRGQPLAAPSKKIKLPPTVVDADGLNALAAREDAWWDEIDTALVLTPHPGEMGRLLDREVREVQADRLATVQEAATRFGQVVVLKGAYTVVAAPDGRASIAPYANDALAKAGAGDVLGGMIGALLGQGVEPYDAARVAVVAHGLAGERVRALKGSQGVIASDLLDVLPEVWRQLASLRNP